MCPTFGVQFKRGGRFSDDLFEWGGGLVEQLSSSYLKVMFDRETAVRDNPESEARIITWEWVER